jgi:hypothetical protein
MVLGIAGTPGRLGVRSVACLAAQKKRGALEELRGDSWVALGQFCRAPDE